MAKSCDASIQRKSVLVCEQVLDHRWCDFMAVLVMSAFCNNDNCLPLSNLAVLLANQ